MGKLIDKITIMQFLKTYSKVDLSFSNCGCLTLVEGAIQDNSNLITLLQVSP